jgi:tripartite-type tricarboxylate transporter receptor subunit TctC
MVPIAVPRKSSMVDRRHVVIAVALIGLGLAVPARAQDKYPSRPIKLLVPFPAGGAVDVMGRLIGQRLSSTLGQQVIVENRPGAGSTLAGRAAASAEPDGYTLLLASAATMAIGPALYNNAGYDPLTSFAPIGMLSSVPYVMIAGQNVPANTVLELVAYAKANPGKLNFGVPNGAPPHMIAAWFRAATGTDIVIVPYRGASTVITDLMGGQIQLGVETTSVTFGHVHEGKIKALGVATRSRLAELPEVPTVIEGGVPDFIASSWTGLMAPAGTPKEIVMRLNAELNASLHSPEIKQRLHMLGAEAHPGTPADFMAFIVQEIPKWQAMARLAGVKAE